MTREQWRKHYRQLRIIRREAWKACQDMIIFGTGAVKVGADVPDLIQYVAIRDLFEGAQP